MKSVFFITVVFGVLIAVYMAAPPLENDSKEMLDECRESEKPSDEDIQIFLDHRAPQTLNGKCLLACMYEKSGVIQNGHIQVEGLKAEVMKRFGGDEKNTVPINEIVEECRTINFPERCEQAKIIKNCLDKTAIVRGFN